MPAAEHVFDKQIGEYLRDRLDDQLRTELGLKHITFGDLRAFPADADIVASVVPMIIIQTQNVRPNFLTIGGQRYEVDYEFRVLYIGYLTEGITQEHARRAFRRVCDVIWEDIALDAAATDIDFGSPAKGQIQYSHIGDIEFRPVEDDFLLSINANLFVAAVGWKVRSLMFK